MKSLARSPANLRDSFFAKGSIFVNLFGSPL
jgi:hypothetical protein